MSDLVYTRVEDIPLRVNAANRYFVERQKRLSGEKSPRKVDIQERLSTLKKFYWAVKDHSEDLVEALYKDLHRSYHESWTLEVLPLLNNILYLIDNMEKELKPKRVKDANPVFRFGKIEIEKIAVGTCLIISPFNFPILLCFDPLAGAIACGNSVVVKASELTPHCAQLLELICREAFESGQVEFVQGAVTETTALLDMGKFDKIFYTGSPAVGSIIAGKAAKTLTPCVLELGGKSPVFVTADLPKSKWKTAARRILFSSFGNSGQVCVAADYVICEKSMYDEFVATCVETMNEFFPQLTSETEFTHMIHERAYNNITKILETSKGEKHSVQVPEGTELQSLCVTPTIVSGVDWEDSTMVSENFGPILPIVSFTDIDEVIDIVLQKHDTPLVQYIFSEKQSTIDHILTRIRSGDCIVGDTMVHVAIEKAPFGGIGKSGYGSYHGPWTFNAFTHERTVFRQPYWVDVFLGLRYPPFKPKKTQLAKMIMENKPNFDRNGNRIWNWKFLSVIGIALAFIAAFFSKAL